MQSVRALIDAGRSALREDAAAARDAAALLTKRRRAAAWATTAAGSRVGERVDAALTGRDEPWATRALARDAPLVHITLSVTGPATLRVRGGVGAVRAASGPFGACHAARLVAAVGRIGERNADAIALFLRRHIALFFATSTACGRRSSCSTWWRVPTRGPFTSGVCAAEVELVHPCDEIAAGGGHQ